MSTEPSPTSASTLNHVGEVLTMFLADPQPGVLALKGEWGVGKTYLWNRFINRQRQAAGCDSYAYASVFGVANTTDLRRTFDREILLNPTVTECYNLIFDDRRFEEAAAKPTPSTPFQPTDPRPLLEIFESVNVSNIRWRAR